MGSCGGCWHGGWCLRTYLFFMYKTTPPFFNAAAQRAATRRSPTATATGAMLSVTAGNWLSQHGGRSSTGREAVLPRRQKSCPPCVVSSPRGEVALPYHRARQPHSARQSSVASSARRRAPPSAVGAFFLGSASILALHGTRIRHDGAAHACRTPRRCRRRR